MYGSDISDDFLFLPSVVILSNLEYSAFEIHRLNLLLVCPCLEIDFCGCVKGKSASLSHEIQYYLGWLSYQQCEGIGLYPLGLVGDCKSQG